MLDALDECGQTSREELLDIIADEFVKLPGLFRFIITSRADDNDINAALAEQPHILAELLDITTQESTQDIRLFMQERMQHVRKLKKQFALSLDWPGGDVTDQLAQSQPVYLFGHQSYVHSCWKDAILASNWINYFLLKALQRVRWTHYIRRFSTSKAYGQSVKHLLRIFVRC